VALALHWLTAWANAASAEVSLTSPEAVGFSAVRLERLDVVMRQAVDDGEYAGVVTLVARHGKLIHFKAYGKSDLATSAAMERDAIFRINSITKPITAAAMMLLYEEGKWNPQDPIAKFIPQFADLKIYKGTGPTGSLQVEDPAHLPTMAELMTHTAGFGDGGGLSPVERLYRGEGDQYLFLCGSLQKMIDRLSKAPLLYQPSTQWAYGVSSEIQGYVIEKLSGQTLPRFLKDRLFGPLRMTDTDFYVPTQKRSRFATLYTMGTQEKLVATDLAAYGLTYDGEPGFPSGGAGLVSTAMDYFRFAQMLLNGGELDGVRVLSPQTIKLMISNHLPESLMTPFQGGGYQFIKPRPGVGYGFGGAVLTDSVKADMPMGNGSYLWDGASGAWFWIDPTYDIVFVGMTQRIGWGWSRQAHVLGMPTNLEELSRATVYQALLRPER